MTRSSPCSRSISSHLIASNACCTRSEAWSRRRRAAHPVEQPPGVFDSGLGRSPATRASKLSDMAHQYNSHSLAAVSTLAKTLPQNSPFGSTATNVQKRSADRVQTPCVP